MEEEFSVGEYVDLLRRRAPVIAGLLVGSIVLALVWSTAQTEQYRSSANILINQRASSVSALSGDTSVAGAGRFARTEAAVLASELVADHASERLGFDAEITVSAGNDTDILRVVAVSDVPERAQLIAQVFAESYVQVSRDRFAQERVEASASLAEQIQAIDQQLATSTGDEQVRLTALRADYAASLERLRFSVDLASTTRAQIIDTANLPRAPFEPSTTKHLIFGGLVGLILGGAAAVLVESLDRSVTTGAQIEAILGRPSLASIPPLDDGDELVTLTKPTGLPSEAFRSLRAALDFAAVGRQIQVLQITSPAASAGKTTIASNLAVVAAQAGRRVAIIDGDFRRPRVHEVFSIDQRIGFTSLILGDSDAATRNEITAEPGSMHVIPTGPIPPGPTELLGSERVNDVFEELKVEFDLVIIDCPPVLSISDALILSKYSDATMVVVNARKSRRDELAAAVAQLRQAGAPVIGAVLNETDQSASRGDRYGYGYGHQPIVAHQAGEPGGQPANSGPEDQSRFQEVIAERRPVGPAAATTKVAEKSRARTEANAGGTAKTATARRQAAKTKKVSEARAKSKDASRSKGSDRSNTSVGTDHVGSLKGNGSGLIGPFTGEAVAEWLDDD